MSHITPAPMVPIPTIAPLEGSRYEERVQLRQDFQKQEHASYFNQYFTCLHAIIGESHLITFSLLPADI